MADEPKKITITNDYGFVLVLILVTIILGFNDVCRRLSEIADALEGKRKPAVEKTEVTQREQTP
jgi:hypothetical protein